MGRVSEQTSDSDWEIEMHLRKNEQLTQRMTVRPTARGGLIGVIIVPWPPNITHVFEPV